MKSAFLALIIWFVSATMFGTGNAHAQANEPREQQLTPQLLQYLTSYFKDRQECFNGYHFGSVKVLFNENYADHSYEAGSKVTISGTLANENDYPLVNGVVLARLLRQDETVAAENWHPMVLEQSLPGNYDLLAKGTGSFSFDWAVPAEAPAGIYRLELFYLAGQRYVISGIPYVANSPASSTIFSVVNKNGSPRYANFDISTVQLNEQPLKLRSVPPTLPANEPVNISVNIKAESPDAIPVTLHSALYAWSDSDKKPPVWERTSHISIDPLKPFAATMHEDKLTPGAYELVMTITPDDPNILTSMVKVRFPIEGNMPRIIYSGIGGYENGQAIITTCTVNGTFDKIGSKAGGSVGTKIETGGQVLGEGTTDTIADRLTTATIKVPLTKEAKAQGLTISTIARNDQGVQSDTNSMVYSAAMLFPKHIPWIWLFLGLIAILIIIGAVLLILVRRKKSNSQTGIVSGGAGTQVVLIMLILSSFIFGNNAKAVTFNEFINQTNPLSLNCGVADCTETGTLAVRPQDIVDLNNPDLQSPGLGLLDAIVSDTANAFLTLYAQWDFKLVPSSVESCGYDIVPLSTGEVVSYGDIFYDSPPITFAGNSIQAQVSNMTVRFCRTLQGTCVAVSAKPMLLDLGAWRDKDLKVTGSTTANAGNNVLPKCQLQPGSQLIHCAFDKPLPAESYFTVSLTREFGGRMGGVVSGRRPTQDIVAHVDLHAVCPGSSPSPSPSGTPTNTPTGTPTSTPSGTPTTTPSTTPSVSPSVSPSPSPSPSKSPSPSPSTIVIAPPIQKPSSNPNPLNPNPPNPNPPNDPAPVDKDPFACTFRGDSICLNYPRINDPHIPSFANDCVINNWCLNQDGNAIVDCEDASRRMTGAPYVHCSCEDIKNDDCVDVTLGSSLRSNLQILPYIGSEISQNASRSWLAVIGDIFKDATAAVAGWLR